MPTAQAARTRLLARIVAGVAALLLLGLVVSVFGHASVAHGGTEVGLFRGVLTASWGHTNPRVQVLTPGIHWVSNDPGLNWRFGGGTTTSGVGFISAPLWPFLLVFCGLGLWLFRRAAKQRDPFACMKCGYDQSGLDPGTPCPECGHKH